MWSGFSIWAEQSKGEEGTEGRRLWRWPPVHEKEGEGASGPGLVAKVGPAFCGGQDAFSPGYGGTWPPGDWALLTAWQDTGSGQRPDTSRRLRAPHTQGPGPSQGLSQAPARRGRRAGRLPRVSIQSPGCSGARTMPSWAGDPGRPQAAGWRRGGPAQPSPAQDGPDSTHVGPQDRSWVTLQEKQERAAQLNLPRRKQAQRGEGRPRLQAGLEPRLHSQGALASKRCLGDTRSRRGVRTGQ